MRRDSWVTLMDDEEQAGSLVPILALAHENHPDPEMRPYKEPISAEMREKLIVGAATGVAAIYDYFEACPCGSGKKFKHVVPRRRCIEVAHLGNIEGFFSCSRRPTGNRFDKNKEGRMTTLVIGSGLIGSQVARILVERGEKPVLMDNAAQPQAIGQIVDLAKVTLIAGDVLRPLSIVDALRTHGITKIAHTAANPLLTLGAQKEPYSAINLNIMGTRA
jgi:hypothetical protein